VVHGDELNGIKIIHHVLEQLDPADLHGAVVCAPVVNVPAFHVGQRRFPEDDRDLNHVFPGKREGTPSEQYARAFATTFLPALDYLVDIHTASEGRVNTFYVRADLHQEEARRLALSINPEIVLHSRSGDGTLRNAARIREVPAITLEAGNPSVFQGRMALQGELGIMNILADLHIVRGDPPQPIDREPVICASSRWLRTTCGGLIHPSFGLGDRIEKRQPLAEVVDPFGHTTQSYHAPSAGVVIGMAKSPLAVPGTRYCHLGAVGEPPPKKRTRRLPRQAAPSPGEAQ
jgi:predicted deacylase